MERLAVSPTRSNLMQLRDELEFAYQGKELLSQKREVLVMELMRLREDSERVRSELDELLARAYDSFSVSAMREGFAAMERLALSVPDVPHLDFRERHVMGVVLPTVESETLQWQLSHSVMPGSSASDQTIALFIEVSRKLLAVAEIETAIYRLAMETRKTLRRERALENLFIPQFQSTIRFLEETLEEKEREELYQKKHIKEKLQS